MLKKIATSVQKRGEPHNQTESGTNWATSKDRRARAQSAGSHSINHVAIPVVTREPRAAPVVSVREGSRNKHNEQQNDCEENSGSE
jgi:hypothetical protein